jgi:hypothetical protein
VAPFGVRFWDAVTQRFIDDGLTVTAFPQGRETQRVSLVPNRSGAYALHKVSGMRLIEPKIETADFWQNPPTPRPFVVEVVDEAGRFQPFTFAVELPVRGLFVWPGAPIASPLSPPAPGVPLFSTPARQTPGVMAVLRAELWDLSTERPAAWALLEARIAGQPSVRGLADARGRVALIFPYPEPLPGSLGSPIGSPPGGGTRSLLMQQWPIELRGFYSPEEPPPIPQLERVYEQAPATLVSSLSPLLPLSEALLSFGQELVVRSQARSVLLLMPAGSPL